MTNQKLLCAGFAAWLLLFSAVGVPAQEPTPAPSPAISAEKLALIREMLELTSSKKTIDAMFKAQSEELDKEMPESGWRLVSGMKELRSLTPEQLEEIHSKVIASSAGVGGRVYELLQERIDFRKVIEDVFVPLHDQYLSEAELRDLVVFYKSPTGKKVIEIMPNVLTAAMTQTIEKMMPSVMEIVTRVQDEEIERMRQEIKAIVKEMGRSAKPVARTPPKRRRH